MTDEKTKYNKHQRSIMKERKGNKNKEKKLKVKIRKIKIRKGKYKNKPSK